MYRKKLFHKSNFRYNAWVLSKGYMHNAFVHDEESFFVFNYCITVCFSVYIFMISLLQFTYDVVWPAQRVVSAEISITRKSLNVKWYKVRRTF